MRQQMNGYHVHFHSVALILFIGCGSSGQDSPDDSGTDAEDADLDILDPWPERPPECDPWIELVSNALHTSAGDLLLSHAEVDVRHRRDADETEDGCVLYVAIGVCSGSSWDEDGCRIFLESHIPASLSPGGGLTFDHTTFQTMDTACPLHGDFPCFDALECEWATAEVLLSESHVLGHNVPESCIETTLTTRLEGDCACMESPEDVLHIYTSEIVIRGEFRSIGTDFPCP